MINALNIMEFTFNLADLAWFLLIIVGLVVGVYLIIALQNLIKVLKHSHQILEENRLNIQETMDLLPGVVDNLNDITYSLKESANKAEMTIDSIGGTLSEAVATVGNSVDNIAVYSKIIQEVFHIVTEIFSRRKK